MGFSLGLTVSCHIGKEPYVTSERLFSSSVSHQLQRLHGSVPKLATQSVRGRTFRQQRTSRARDTKEGHGSARGQCLLTPELRRIGYPEPSEMLNFASNKKNCWVPAFPQTTVLYNPGLTFRRGGEESLKWAAVKRQPKLLKVFHKIGQ